MKKLELLEYAGKSCRQSLGRQNKCVSNKSIYKFERKKKFFLKQFSKLGLQIIQIYK